MQTARVPPPVLNVCFFSKQAMAIFILFQVFIAAGYPVECASHQAPMQCREATSAELAFAGFASPQCPGARQEAHSTGLTRRNQHFEKCE
uniref:Uncharacterized protein n=1 Tax=Ixodes ricinus TaxID=34613 RepID=A0A6B0UBI2_IXORI